MCSLLSQKRVQTIPTLACLMNITQNVMYHKLAFEPIGLRVDWPVSQMSWEQIVLKHNYPEKKQFSCVQISHEYGSFLPMFMS